MTMHDSDAQDIILLVDDEQNILRSLKRELLDMPYGLLTASSASMALELLLSHNIAVIISDQRMPKTCGTELLALVREKYPDTVRILLTAFSDMQDIIDAINKGGIYKFLLKPWNTNELKQIIAEAVDHYRLVRVKNRAKQSILVPAAEAGSRACPEGHGP